VFQSTCLDTMSVVSRLEPWPSANQLSSLRSAVLDLSRAQGARCKSGEEGRRALDNDEGVLVVAAPYRICPLGAHIDHQGGVVGNSPKPQNPKP